MPIRSLDKDPLYEGLVLSLPLFEGTGTERVADVSKAHHPMTLVHSPVWTQLSNGLWVLDFDGANDYIRCPADSSTDLNFTTGDFSTCLWIYPHSVSGTRVWMSNVGTQEGWRFISNGVDVIFGYYAPASRYIGASSVLTVSSWQLVGFSRRGDSGSLYLNGSPLALTSNTLSGNPASSANNFCLAASPTGALFFRGYLWNPLIWSRYLAPHEHKAVFNRYRHLPGI